MRGVVFKKGNEDGTDMYALIFNGLGGKDLLNAPIAEGMPYARQGNTLYMKTNVVNNNNTTKGRFPFGFQFSCTEKADAFEAWFTNITKTKNCFTCNAPSTLPLLQAANAQVDAAIRSPPSKKVLSRALISYSSPDDPMFSSFLCNIKEKVKVKEEASSEEETEVGGLSSSDDDDEEPRYNSYKGSPPKSQYWF